MMSHSDYPQVPEPNRTQQMGSKATKLNIKKMMCVLRSLISTMVKSNQSAKRKATSKNQVTHPILLVHIERDLSQKRAHKFDQR